MGDQAIYQLRYRSFAAATLAAEQNTFARFDLDIDLVQASMCFFSMIGEIHLFNINHAKDLLPLKRYSIKIFVFSMDKPLQNDTAKASIDGATTIINGSAWLLPLMCYIRSNNKCTAYQQTDVVLNMKA